MKLTKSMIGCVLACAAGMQLHAAELTVTGSTLPVIQDVDVLVLGGGSGAVAAAVKASQEGAKTFLVAPRPYLGEDLAGKLRLNLEGQDFGNHPLLAQMFAGSGKVGSFYPYTYTTDAPAQKPHADPQGTGLCDGAWEDSATESVQYTKTVNITMDLGTPREIKTMQIYFFENAPDYNTEAFELEGGADGKTWTKISRTKDRGSFGTGDEVGAEISCDGTYRYLRLKAVMAAGAKRQLLGEVLVLPRQTAAQPVFSSQTRPLQIKKALDEALLAQGIGFLTGAVATEPVYDANGEIAGAVIANRSGRQIIKAKTVIDATERAIFTRQAGAEATPFPAGDYIFERVVIAGEAPAKDKRLSCHEIGASYQTKVAGIKAPTNMPTEIEGRMFVCQLKLPMKDASPQSFAEAEQMARDLTFTKTILEASDTLFLVPPDYIKSAAGPQSGVSASDVALTAFQPKGIKNLFVFGGMGDVDRKVAAQLMRVGSSLTLGDRIGVAAAQMAKARKALGAVTLKTKPGKGAPVLHGENKTGLASFLVTVTNEFVNEGSTRTLSVIGSCDVFVAGAGTGGGPAGIAAARQGAKTLVVDYLHQMGGVQTDGLIGVYYYGNRVGFTKEIDAGVQATGAVFVQAKAEWYRAENRKAGAEIWFGALVTGVIVEKNKVTGIVVVAPNGEYGIIQCKMAIDGTGNAELAAMAGEETEFITSQELALQGVGQTPKRLGNSYINTDIAFLDDTDAADLFYFALRSRFSMKGVKIWDQAQVINSRERRRMIGAFYMSPLDVVNNRTYPDVVVQTRSNFDSHGFTVHPQFFIEDPGHQAMMVNLPYRCLLPKTLDNLLVVGLGISAHRDAMPILRMQPDVQNQGYAVGVAAAMAIKAKVTARNVNMPKLQKHLIEKGVVPKDVLSMKDSFPLAPELFKTSIGTLTNNYTGLSILMTDYDQSYPLLKKALQDAQDDAGHLVYAHTLGIMGFDDGQDALIEKIKADSWDKGWNYRGMGQFNRSVSWMDSYIIALGRCKSKKAVPAIINRASELTVANEFSHFRAVALALEGIGDKAGAPVLAELLRKPEIGGHSLTYGKDIQAIPRYGNNEGDKERTRCLRELVLARALFRLGDVDGLGRKTLEAWAKDPRGAYAKHARLILEGK